MFIIIVHQFGNAETACVAMNEDGNNAIFDSEEKAENYAADGFLGVFDYTVLEV